ncbi:MULTISPECIES: nitrogen fixation protein NifX [Magnetospirillum]|uniref:Nitrogen fixation protein NifX n=1 Tax=Magnetospirillum moscoviense TaxID=1437059 RepID=A0A178MEE5_9PROT|nr:MULTISPECIES: nitrogen fixation protein NifX [Magnetospirillum]MBF0323751.1 nitrogen fixation protein NifX [Alphaproteobacteria bacterium]OAN46418.1 nitrogen fixation protein NifX [Magnetospirillum moscoviense]CAA7613336.1 Protein NifX [Magnetospirillum sp. LM-5]
MRLAFATHDRTHVDAHFASAKTFLFYDVGPDSYAFLEAVQFGTVTQEDGNHDEGEDRLATKIDALGGTSLLFVRAIGGPAAARVVRAKVHPIKLPNDETITAVIDRVQTMLKTNPPPWLRRALKDSEGGDERFIDDEG